MLGFPSSFLKFNVDGAARGEPLPASIGGVLWDHEESFHCFFKAVGVKDSNDAAVLAILEAFGIYSSSFHKVLIVESDSSNA